MPNRTRRRYGWRKDLPDHRDYQYRHAMAAPGVQAGFLAGLMPCVFGKRPPVPKAVDLTEGGRSPNWGPVYDQGDLGSCVENALCGAMGYVLALEKVPLPKRFLSRLFLYWYARGGIPSDTGSTIRDGVKAMAAKGDCLESTWPYDLAIWRSEPSFQAQQEAQPERTITYARLTSLADMKQCLATDKHPFVFGISVYESFETDITRSHPVCPMPKAGESFLGGHALCAVGYDDGAQCLLVRNSWGPSWGKDGFFYLPYSYATNSGLAGDYWTVRSIPVV